VPPNHRLKSGLTVEVLHLSTRKPSADWLRDVRTPRARSAIRRWLTGAGRHESIELGRRIVETNYKRLHVSAPLTDHVPSMLQHFGVLSLEQLYQQVGKGEITAARVAAFFHERTRRAPAPTRMVSQLVDTLTGKPSGVLVGGSESMMVRFGHCCHPIPGDPIVGFVTRGRGIVVHRRDCEHAALFLQDTERTIDVSWDTRVTNTYIVFLEMEAEDRPGLLHDISGVFVNFGSNVLEARVQTLGAHCRNTFKIQIQNRNQLRQILDRLQKIRGVERIARSREAGAAPAGDDH
jgi:GTP diphosphokinase / guanosine-3',5'-bis(diphosphate) 3'-diphosphatase